MPNSLLEGTNLNDVALSGSHDTDAGTFNYYGYSRTDGSWVILREKDDETEYRYAVGSVQRNDSSNYETGFSNRESLVYKTTNQYNF